MSSLDQHPSAAIRTWTSHRRMTVRLASVLNRELADATGLSQADFEVLAELLEHPEDSIRDITLRCGLEWEKSRLSHQLRRMEARGLVARGACFEDSRSSTVSLTEVGKDAARRAKDVEAAVLARYLASALSAEQLEQMTQVSDAILVALESAHPHGASPGNHRRSASEKAGGVTDEKGPAEARLSRA